MFRTSSLLAWLALIVLLPGCAVVDVPPSPVLDAGRSWALLPIQNYSGTPQAGERVEALLASMLHQRGMARLASYPVVTNEESLPELDERRRYARALEWARRQGLGYAITGAVSEWRYKTGPEGEPAVGLTVQIVDIPSATVLWSATGSRSGWGRESVTGTAQKLLRDLLANLDVSAPKAERSKP